MKTRIEGVRRAAYSMLWMMQLPKLEAVLNMLDLRASGVELPESEQARFAGERRSVEPRMAGSVVVLPLYDVIVGRANLMDRISGATSAALFGEAFDQALADPEVSAIVLDVDSPGGSVYQVPELARKIFAARGVKPIVAVANALAASAAYYIAAAAERFVVTPSGEVGSVGVFMAHDDVSAAMAMAGVKRTYIEAGEHKTEGNPYEPLGEETRAYWQSQVDDYYAMFVADVARFRRGAGKPLPSVTLTDLQAFADSLDALAAADRLVILLADSASDHLAQDRTLPEHCVVLATPQGESLVEAYRELKLATNGHGGPVPDVFVLDAVTDAAAEVKLAEAQYKDTQSAKSGCDVKDAALLVEARAYADLPGGHSEGYDDTFKQMFRRFYSSISEPGIPPEYPQFIDGLRQLTILKAELESHRTRGWIDLPAL